jgi:hypothetical protein
VKEKAHGMHQRTPPFSCVSSNNLRLSGPDYLYDIPVASQLRRVPNPRQFSRLVSSFETETHGGHRLVFESLALLIDATSFVVED